MDKNTIIIKPSQNMVEQNGWDSVDDIVRNCYAQGFRGSYKVVKEFTYIIITDGIGKAIIGDISNVEHTETQSIAGRKVSRVNVTFENPREFNFNEISGIRWSSLNVRYMNIA